MAPVAPVSVVSSCGSSIYCSSGSSIGFVVRGSGGSSGSSSICRSWRQYISCRLWLQYLSLLWGLLRYLLSFMAPPVSVACGSIGCRLWLWYLLSFMSPVSPVVHGSISICRLWLQYHLLLLVDPLVIACGSSGSSSICRSWLQSICRSWLRYLLWLSFVAPVAVVLSYGSSICCAWLYHQYLLLVVVVCGSCDCHGRLPFCVFNRQSSSVLVIFL